MIMQILLLLVASATTQAFYQGSQRGGNYRQFYHLPMVRTHKSTGSDINPRGWHSAAAATGYVGHAPSSSRVVHDVDRVKKKQRDPSVMRTMAHYQENMSKQDILLRLLERLNISIPCSNHVNSRPASPLVSKRKTSLPLTDAHKTIETINTEDLYEEQRAQQQPSSIPYTGFLGSQFDKKSLKEDETGINEFRDIHLQSVSQPSLIHENIKGNRRPKSLSLKRPTQLKENSYNKILHDRMLRIQKSRNNLGNYIQGKRSNLQIRKDRTRDFEIGFGNLNVPNDGEHQEKQGLKRKKTRSYALFQGIGQRHQKFPRNSAFSPLLNRRNFSLTKSKTNEKKRYLPKSSDKSKATKTNLKQNTDRTHLKTEQDSSEVKALLEEVYKDDNNTTSPDFHHEKDSPAEQEISEENINNMSKQKPNTSIVDKVQQTPTLRGKGPVIKLKMRTMKSTTDSKPSLSDQREYKKETDDKHNKESATVNKPTISAFSSKGPAAYLHRDLQSISQKGKVTERRFIKIRDSNNSDALENSNSVVLTTKTKDSEELYKAGEQETGSGNNQDIESDSHGMTEDKNISFLLSSFKDRNQTKITKLSSTDMNSSNIHDAANYSTVLTKSLKDKGSPFDDKNFYSNVFGVLDSFNVPFNDSSILITNVSNLTDQLAKINDNMKDALSKTEEEKRFRTLDFSVEANISQISHTGNRSETQSPHKLEREVGEKELNNSYRYFNKDNSTVMTTDKTNKGYDSFRTGQDLLNTTYKLDSKDSNSNKPLNTLHSADKTKPERTRGSIQDASNGSSHISYRNTEPLIRQLSESNITRKSILPMSITLLKRDERTTATPLWTLKTAGREDKETANLRTVAKIKPSSDVKQLVDQTGSSLQIHDMGWALNTSSENQTKIPASSRSQDVASENTTGNLNLIGQAYITEFVEFMRKILGDGQNGDLINNTLKTNRFSIDSGLFHVPPLNKSIFSLSKNATSITLPHYKFSNAKLIGNSEKKKSADDKAILFKSPTIIENKTLPIGLKANMTSQPVWSHESMNDFLQVNPLDNTTEEIKNTTEPNASLLDENDAIRINSSTVANTERQDNVGASRQTNDSFADELQNFDTMSNANRSKEARDFQQNASSSTIEVLERRSYNAGSTTLRPSMDSFNRNKSSTFNRTYSADLTTVGPSMDYFNRNKSSTFNRTYSADLITVGPSMGSFNKNESSTLNYVSPQQLSTNPEFTLSDLKKTGHTILNELVYFSNAKPDGGKTVNINKTKQFDGNKPRSQLKIPLVSIYIKPRDKITHSVRRSNASMSLEKKEERNTTRSVQLPHSKNNANSTLHTLNHSANDVPQDKVVEAVTVSETSSISYKSAYLEQQEPTANGSDVLNSEIQIYDLISKNESYELNSEKLSYELNSTNLSYVPNSKNQSYELNSENQTFELNSENQTFELNSKNQSFELNSKNQSFQLNSKNQSFELNSKNQSFELNSKNQSFELNSKNQSYEEKMSLGLWSKPFNQSTLINAEQLTTGDSSSSALPKHTFATVPTTTADANLTPKIEWFSSAKPGTRFLDPFIDNETFLNGNNENRKAVKSTEENVIASFKNVSFTQINNATLSDIEGDLISFPNTEKISNSNGTSSNVNFDLLNDRIFIIQPSGNKTFINHNSSLIQSKNSTTPNEDTKNLTAHQLLYHSFQNLSSAPNDKKGNISVIARQTETSSGTRFENITKESLVEKEENVTKKVSKPSADHLPVKTSNFEPAIAYAASKHNLSNLQVETRNHSTENNSESTSTSQEHTDWSDRDETKSKHINDSSAEYLRNAKSPSWAGESFSRPNKTEMSRISAVLKDIISGNESFLISKASLSIYNESDSNIGWSDEFNDVIRGFETIGKLLDNKTALIHHNETLQSSTAMPAIDSSKPITPNDSFVPRFNSKNVTRLDFGVEEVQYIDDTSKRLTSLLSDVKVITLSGLNTTNSLDKIENSKPRNNDAPVILSDTEVVTSTGYNETSEIVLRERIALRPDDKETNNSTSGFNMGTVLSSNKTNDVEVMGRMQSIQIETTIKFSDSKPRISSSHNETDETGPSTSIKPDDKDTTSIFSSVIKRNSPSKNKTSEVKATGPMLLGDNNSTSTSTVFKVKTTTSHNGSTELGIIDHGKANVTNTPTKDGEIRRVNFIEVSQHVQTETTGSSASQNEFPSALSLENTSSTDVFYSSISPFEKTTIIPDHKETKGLRNTDTIPIDNKEVDSSGFSETRNSSIVKKAHGFTSPNKKTLERRLFQHSESVGNLAPIKLRIVGDLIHDNLTLSKNRSFSDILNSLSKAAKDASINSRQELENTINITDKTPMNLTSPSQVLIRGLKKDEAKDNALLKINLSSIECNGTQTGEKNCGRPTHPQLSSTSKSVSANESKHDYFVGNNTQHSALEIFKAKTSNRKLKSKDYNPLVTLKENAHYYTHTGENAIRRTDEDKTNKTQISNTTVVSELNGVGKCGESCLEQSKLDQDLNNTSYGEQLPLTLDLNIPKNKPYGNTTKERRLTIPAQNDHSRRNESRIEDIKGTSLEISKLTVQGNSEVGYPNKKILKENYNDMEKSGNKEIYHRKNNNGEIYPIINTTQINKESYREDRFDMAEQNNNMDDESNYTINESNANYTTNISSYSNILGNGFVSNNITTTNNNNSNPLQVGISHENNITTTNNNSNSGTNRAGFIQRPPHDSITYFIHAVFYPLLSTNFGSHPSLEDRTPMARDSSLLPQYTEVGHTAGPLTNHVLTPILNAISRHFDRFHPNPHAQSVHLNSLQESENQKFYNSILDPNTAPEQTMASLKNRPLVSDTLDGDIRSNKMANTKGWPSSFQEHWNGFETSTANGYDNQSPVGTIDINDPELDSPTAINFPDYTNVITEEEPSKLSLLWMARPWPKRSTNQRRFSQRVTPSVTRRSKFFGLLSEIIPRDFDVTSDGTQDFLQGFNSINSKAASQLRFRELPNSRAASQVANQQRSLSKSKLMRERNSSKGGHINLEKASRNNVDNNIRGVEHLINGNQFTDVLRDGALSYSNGLDLHNYNFDEDTTDNIRSSTSDEIGQSLVTSDYSMPDIDTKPHYHRKHEISDINFLYFPNELQYKNRPNTKRYSSEGISNSRSVIDQGYTTFEDKLASWLQKKPFSQLDPNGRRSSLQSLTSSAIDQAGYETPFRRGGPIPILRRREVDNSDVVSGSTAYKNYLLMSPNDQSPTAGLVWSKLSSSSRGVPVKTEFQCKQLFGHHPHPLDCQSFFSCSWGVAYRFACPQGSLFNQLKGICDWAAKVTCYDNMNNHVLRPRNDW